MVKTIRIQQNQVGILFKNNNFVSFLEPGTYTYFDPLNTYSCEKHSLEAAKVNSSAVESIRVNNPKDFAAYIQIIEPKENEVIFVYSYGRFSEVFTHGTHGYFWKKGYGFSFESYSIAKPVISEKELEALRQKGVVNNTVLGMYSIPQGHKGLLYVNNELVAQYDAGIYGIWQVAKNVEFKSIDLRVTELEVTGQEVLTKDKVTIRMNVVCYFKVNDPALVYQKVQDYREMLYKQVQFAIRNAVEARTIEEILNIRGELNTELQNQVAAEVKEFGIEIDQIGIKDIILPGEMREIFNQVIQAEKHAQANLIKRREEVAATRSLLNTARLMEENPVLLRLKELEYTENILSKVENLSVYGGVEDIIGSLFTGKGKSKGK